MNGWQSFSDATNVGLQNFITLLTSTPLFMKALGITSIDEGLFEAARIDGASDGQIFRRITLPLLRPIVLYTFVTSFIGGLQVFDIPFIMTQGGPQNGVYTLSIFIYNQAFAYRNYGLASAASVLLLIISAVVSILMFRGFRER
ncbi:lactose transport system permease protein LacF-like, partial [Colletes gigas]|uniref:lactose transport system permease protein LacF-like n=1 Tax=Colletes gigas TaxID=935657 RepID=UPI001C9B7EF6